MTRPPVTIVHSTRRIAYLVAFLRKGDVDFVVDMQRVFRELGRHLHRMRWWTIGVLVVTHSRRRAANDALQGGDVRRASPAVPSWRT